MEARVGKAMAVCWLLLLGAACSVVLGQPVAEIRVPVCSAPPQLDAQLNDPCWQSATRLTGFHLITTGKPAEVQTTAWLCRDDTWLYLAFRCDEPNVGSIRQMIAVRDGAVSQDDSVEIFIDPGTGGKEYAHLGLSAGNVQRDQWCRGAERIENWDLPWRSAAQPDPHIDTGKGWSAELAIPLALLQQRPGSEPWRINLCRTRRASSPAEFSSLAPFPAGSGFHSPQHFLIANGLTGFKAKPIFGPMLGEIKVRPLTVAEGQYSYQLAVTVRNRAGLEGTVEVVAQDLPRLGKGKQVAQAVELGRKDQKEVALAIEVAGPAARDAWVGLREPGATFWLQKADVAGMEALTPFDPYLDRNYYTTEREARVYAEMRVGAEERAKAGLNLQAKIVGEQGKVISFGSATCSRDVVAIALPLKKVPLGRHMVKVSLLDGKKNSLGTVELSLVKEPPTPAGTNEVKIDRYNRCLLVNGKPFFPMGAVGLGMHPTGDWRREFVEAQYGYCREAGLNFVCDWAGYGGTPESLEACRANYDLAQKYGLRVVGKPYSHKPDLYYGNPKFREAAMSTINAMDPYLKMAREHPAVIGYYHFDEPGGTRHITDILENYRTKVHSLDSYHPVYVSMCRYLHAHNKPWFDTVADLMGTHNYWYVMRRGSLRSMSGYWNMLDTNAREAHSPTMAVPQLDYWGTGYMGGGFMLPNEQRAQTYLALAHGARSVMYFVLPFRHETSVQVQKGISAEVQQLAPALLTREPGQELTFEPEGACTAFPMANVAIRGQEDRKYPLVVPSLRQYPDGSQVLLAVNPGDLPVTVRFTISSLTAQSKVEAMFGEKKKYGVKEKSFTDTLEPFGTRAYRLTATQNPKDQPIRIHLAMSGPAVEEAIKLATRAEPEPPAEEPKKNLVYNSSFEQARMPGHPDMWHAHVYKYLIPDERACGLGTDNPFHGKYCFRVIRPYPNDTFAYGQPVPVKRDTTYTLSAYLRADKPKTRVRLSMFGEIKFVELDTTWKRYWITASSKQATSTPIIFFIWQNGTMYVDAVQLEEGAEPTEYEPN